MGEVCGTRRMRRLRHTRLIGVSDLLVWIDCEMTGLDLERDEIVEVAVVVTDYDLKPLDPGFNVVTPGSGVIMMAPVSVCHHVSTTGHRPPPMVW